MTRTRPARVPAWLVAALVVVVGSLPLVRQFLLAPDDAHWMVDLNVYREAGVSNLTGRPVYEWLTPPPQNLPFTYPPFASILAIPLALLPFRVVGWIWFGVQLAANLAIVRIAAADLLDPSTLRPCDPSTLRQAQDGAGSGRRRLRTAQAQDGASSGRRRLGRWRGLVWGGLTVAMIYLLPVSDGLRFGQVNALLVLACLVDFARPDLLRRLPQGVLVGLATAIKLTPGVFIVGYLVTRQWRAALTAIATTAGVTLAAFALLPGASIAFWGGALQDADRLGPNDGTANQSLRAVLMRHVPAGTGREILWVALVLVVVVLGYAAARRACGCGDRLLAFCLVAVIGLLVSPVSWTHHFHWLVPTICLLAACGVAGSRHAWSRYAARSSRLLDPSVSAPATRPTLRGATRPALMAAAVALWLTFLLHLTWWAHWRLVDELVYDPARSTGDPFWSVLHNAYALAAVLTLLGLALLAWRRGPRPAAHRPAPAGHATPRRGSRAE